MDMVNRRRRAADGNAAPTEAALIDRKHFLVPN